MAYVVHRAGTNDAATLPARAIAAVRHDLGAVAALKTVHVLPQLPKTRSGKILRKLLRLIANGQPWDIPPTIEDPEVARSIAAQLSGNAAE